MATSHAYPLLLLLLASLFVLPALSVGFNECYRNKEYPVDVKTVEFSPSPRKQGVNANITVTGDASNGIPDGATVILWISVPMAGKNQQEYSLCDVTACPVAPGPLVLTLPNVFTKDQKNSQFAKHGNVVLRIEKKELKHKMIMCLFFDCPKEGYASLLSQVTE